MPVLVIDNYDSFTYNLVQMIGERNLPVVVRRNDQISIKEAEQIAPSHIVISPGPGTPATAGISIELIRHFRGSVPILGVCLGHQCLAEAFGGTVRKAQCPVHGKPSEIFHNGEGIFERLPNPFTATRYHSLIVAGEHLPSVFGLEAWTEHHEVMAVRHKQYPLWGVQFHPESILTREGGKLVSSFFAQQ